MTGLTIRIPDARDPGIRAMIRVTSPALQTQCIDAGMPPDSAVVCAGLLATGITDLIAASRLSRDDYGRAYLLERVMALTVPPCGRALQYAMTCAPVAARAWVAYWDRVCDPDMRGRLADALGVDTPAGRRYGRAGRRPAEAVRASMTTQSRVPTLGLQDVRTAPGGAVRRPGVSSRSPAPGGPVLLLPQTAPRRSA